MEERIKEIIAGPCSAETEEQVLTTARQLSAIGVKCFRAGLWKPRSSYGNFEGVGCKGLPWLKEVKEETGMLTMTEVALPKHVESALKGGVDLLWIGARTTCNPFMISELAEALRGYEKPLYMKNPICPDLKLWVGSIERMDHAGIKEIHTIHRGFKLYDNHPYRNSCVWELVRKFKEECPQVRIYSDPSHIAGDRRYLKEICQQALREGLDRFFIETHPDPDKALTDSKQQLPPCELANFFKTL